MSRRNLIKGAAAASAYMVLTGHSLIWGLCSALDTLGSYAMAAVGGIPKPGAGSSSAFAGGVTPKLDMSQGVSQDYAGPPDVLPDSYGNTPYSPGMGVQGLRRSRYARPGIY